MANKATANIGGGAVLKAESIVFNGDQIAADTQRAYGVEVTYNNLTRKFDISSGSTGEDIPSNSAVGVGDAGQAASNIEIGRLAIVNGEATAATAGTGGTNALADITVVNGAVDTVGGNILANILTHIKPSGIVAACGNASSIKLNTTVMPFIIRGVKLWGIDSVSVSIKRRNFLWGEMHKLVDFDLLDKSIKEINLNQLLEEYPKMLEGKTSGRYIINLNK